MRGGHNIKVLGILVLNSVSITPIQGATLLIRCVAIVYYSHWLKLTLFGKVFRLDIHIFASYTSFIFPRSKFSPSCK